MTATTHHSPPTSRKRRPWFAGAFILVQALFVVWIIAAVASAGPTDCGTLTAADCKAASDAGTAIGVGLVIGLWVAVDFILAVTYAIVRLARRRTS